MNFDTFHKIATGSHLYQFYKSKEDLFGAVIPFFASGLRKGQACLWLVSEKMGIENARRALISSLGDFSEFERLGQVEILSAEEWYLSNDGHFNAEQALENAETFIQEKLRFGFQGIRGTGDPSVVPRSEWDLIEDYECQAHKLVKNAPVIAMCAYPIFECNLQQTEMILNVHDHVMMGYF